MNPLQATFLGDRRYNDRLANYLGAEHRAASEALTREYLQRIEAIDPEQLGREDRLTVATFRLNLANSLEIGEFPEHLLAINQFYSFANQFAQLGSGASAHPFANEQDYRDFLSRIDGFVVLTDQAIANMRVGLDRNVTQPRVLMERVVGQLSALDRDFPESVFYGPIENFPEDMSAAVREQLTEDFAQAYDGKLRPAYQRLRDFIRDDYLPRARASVGLFELPGGEDWYATLVRHTTTTDLTPAEIHEIGLRRSGVDPRGNAPGHGRGRIRRRTRRVLRISENRTELLLRRTRTIDRRLSGHVGSCAKSGAETV